jgi:hypothetical protein
LEIWSGVFIPDDPDLQSLEKRAYRCFNEKKAAWMAHLQCRLKVHKHEILLNFFLPKSNPYVLTKFRKKFRFFSFDFRKNFEVRTFSRWLEHTVRATKFFGEMFKKFFLKMFSWVLLDRFLNGFSKIRFFIVEIGILIRDFWVIFENNSMRMLSIRRNDFITYWAYKETISSHTEHTANKFLRMLSQRKNVHSFYMYSNAEHTGIWFYCTLSIRGNDFIAPWASAEMFKSRISRPNRIRFSKISCFRPLGPSRFGFCKKSI